MRSTGAWRWAATWPALRSARWRSVRRQSRTDIKLQPKKHDTEWQESARLWVALVGSPSTMKTPMMAAAVKPLRRIDNEMASDNQRAMAEYAQAVRRGAEAKRAQPKQTRLMMHGHHDRGGAGDPEGQPERRALLSGRTVRLVRLDGQVFRRAGRRKGPGVLAAGYNGGSYSVNRIRRGTVFIDNLSVSMLGGIQPEPIRKLAEGGEDDGLLQRFIPIVLRPAVVGRDEAPSQAVFDYSDLITQTARTQAADDGRHDARPLPS